MTFETSTITGSITKTDALAMNIKMGTGALVTVSTGFIDIQGGRGAFVHFNSDAAQPKSGDWNYFKLSGTSTSTTMKWCILSNGTLTLAFLNHAPGAGKFQYIINNRSKTNGLYVASSSAGTVIIDDIAVIRSAPILKAGTQGLTVTGLTVLRPLGITTFSKVTNTSTWNDIYIEGLAGGGFVAAAANTITVNRFYCNVFGNDSLIVCGGAGTLNFDDSIFEGGLGVQLNKTGIMSLLNSDISKMNSASLEGVYTTTGKITMDGIWLAGTLNFDISVVDTSIIVPTDQQHRLGTGGTIANVPVGRNFTLDYSNIIDDVTTVGEITTTFTTGVISKSRIVFTETSGGTIIAASPWSAPDVVIPEISETLPCIASDWGLSGKKYSTSHSHTTKLPAGDYFYKIISEDPMGNEFESVEQGAITIGGSNVTTPFTVTLAAGTSFTVEAA